MRLELLFLWVLVGLAVGLPQPQDEEDAAENDEEAEEDEYQEYDVAEAVEDAKAKGTFKYKPGILEEDPNQPEDEASVGYFDKVDDKELVGAERSDSFSAVKEGWASPVRDQGACGSCAAFATLAVFEICYKKLTGKDLDFSEQQLLECGNKFNATLARGCNLAYPHAYMYFMQENKNVSGEKNYPYLGAKTKLPKCAKPGSKAAQPINDEVRVDTAYWTNNSTEDLLRKLVFLHGAVLSTVALDPLQNYKGGIFEGCPPTNRTDHAITVVGYGREKGKDFWLIKNSFGTTWGEKGYLRLLRGVNMCGIGKRIAAINCETISKCEEDDENCENKAEASDEEEEEDEDGEK